VQRRLVAWALWWIAMWWAFMLLAGDWNRIEWIAAAGVATAGATLAELARASAPVRIAVPPERLRHLPAALAMVFADFGTLVLALVRSLVRREVVRGAYVARDFDAQGEAGGAHRAWTVLIAGFSPNAYVVDIDPDRDVVLLHDLVPKRASEKPA
jgi:hypothetical protein